jgi:hypothetical protein
LLDLIFNIFQDGFPVVIDVDHSEDQEYIAEYRVESSPLIFSKTPELPVCPVRDSTRGNDVQNDSCHILYDKRPQDDQSGKGPKFEFVRVHAVLLIGFNANDDRLLYQNMAC